ncbi:phosphate signaling complex protein PhoU [candidate division WOR-3 bacterium]|nr:phosphate signaling complex protein PhoU [candidate division WOR-3 bacterium]
MTRHLQREVNKLKKKILKLGKVVQENLDDAICSVKAPDVELSKKVIQRDALIDLMEVETEEECLKLMALYQPVAIDLRFIIAALKMNNDLERIGDLAVNIAEQTETLSGKKRIKVPFDFDVMSEKVQIMLSNAMDATLNMDVGLARQVCKADDEVDEIHVGMYSKVQEVIVKHPDWADYLIRYLSVSRYLERIADHATNIAEDVIYLVEGEISRHGIGRKLSDKK